MLLEPDERIRRKDWSWYCVEGEEKGKAQRHLLGEAGGNGEGEQHRRQGWPLPSWAGDQVLRQTAESVIGLWLAAPFALQTGKEDWQECHEEI